MLHEPGSLLESSARFWLLWVVNKASLFQKLVTASLFQPAVLNFKELALDVRVRLALGSFGTIICMSQAFADLFAQS
jgi:hypothetical protein